MNAVAVFAFIDERPGTIEVKTGRSNAHPARAAAPTATVVIEATRGTERDEVTGFGQPDWGV
jgi:hypothetical protein